MPAHRLPALRKDSLLWRIDGVAAACAAAALIAAGLLFYVSWSRTWIAVAAGAVVSVLAGLGWYILVLRHALALFEDRLRGRGDYEFDVFISYRLKQHSEMATELYTSLASHDMSVWLDRRGRVPPGPSSLLLSLLGGLRKSRSVIFLVPWEEYANLPPQPKQADAQSLLNLNALARKIIVRLKGVVIRPIEHVVAWWHRSIYAVDLQKRSSESWQEWEGRVARATSIPLFLSVSVRRNDASADQEDVSVRAAASRTSVGIVVNQHGFDDAFVARVRDNLSTISKHSRELFVDDNQARTFVLLFGGLLLCMLAIGACVAVMFALEFIKECLLWPFVKFAALWNKARRKENSARMTNGDAPSSG